ncbi:hypothetical protein BJ508DRAFT_331342 [Ascobolus immersus RN42]|uniref:Uncharacterized protein n=1 Tax=Ascobolus immersus RN42 TaxID=1160509 RepID=A0A3N4HW08_ASCIM|nr:hypothetical protein BJ508DRAFT_331342 [Ascobolus immersus RN42]
MATEAETDPVDSIPAFIKNARPGAFVEMSAKAMKIVLLADSDQPLTSLLDDIASTVGTNLYDCKTIVYGTETGVDMYLRAENEVGSYWGRQALSFLLKEEENRLRDALFDSMQSTILVQENSAQNNQTLSSPPYHTANSRSTFATLLLVEAELHRCFSDEEIVERLMESDDYPIHKMLFADLRGRGLLETSWSDTKTSKFYRNQFVGHPSLSYDDIKADAPAAIKALGGVFQKHRVGLEKIADRYPWSKLDQAGEEVEEEEEEREAEPAVETEVEVEDDHNNGSAEEAEAVADVAGGGTEELAAGEVGGDVVE